MRIRPSRGSGRRLEGEPTDGSRSRRPGGDRFRQSASNGAEPATALAAQGAMASAGAPEAKVCPGTEIADAGAARQPRGPSKVPGSSARGSQGGSPGLLGPVVPAPGLPTRHPRTRRTSGPHAGDGRRVRGGGKRDVVNEIVFAADGPHCKPWFDGSPRGWRKRAARSDLVLSLSKDVNGCTGKLWFGGACC